MAAAELAVLVDELRGVETYLEFGAGGSTALAVREGIPHIWSIESDRDWIARLRDDPHIAAAIAEGRVHLVHGDLGPTENWGYPAGVKDGTIARMPPVTDYHAGIWAHLVPASIDLVLVDGRYRVASALTAIQNCRPSVRLVIHDFWDRPEYAPVLDFAEPVKQARTLVVLRPRAGIDPAALAATIADFARVPQ
jgi:hypothetical protein